MITDVATLVFWCSAGLIVYVYVGYPVLLGLMAALGLRRPVRREDHEPTVTLVISAYNEEAVIAGKLANTLELDYPSDRLRVLVVSDASSDATDEIVRGMAGRGVELLRMPERSGKTLGLNEAVRRTESDILIFSDANALYDRNVIRRMVRNFGDPEVGAVTGESRYEVAPDDQAARSEDRYWQYELSLKRWESDLGSLVGGDGAIYAVRRERYRELDAADISDFVNPLQVVEAGYRNVYEPEAFCYERGAAGFGAEFQRKVRIVNRAWRAMIKMRHLLNPFTRGLFAWQFMSHKVLRWLIGPLLGLLLAANLMILSQHPIYVLALMAQAVVYLPAVMAFLLLRAGREPPRLLEIPYYFCVVNLASAVGILQALRGQKYTTWQTSRAG